MLLPYAVGPPKGRHWGVVMKTRLLCGAALCLLSVGIIPSANASSYTVTELDFYPAAINDAGVVVGNNSNGAVVQNGPTLTVLSTSDSAAAGINDAGQIVGHIGNDPVVWNGTTPTVLSTTLGGSAAGINNAGQIVGTIGTRLGPSAVIWNNSSAIPTLLGGNPPFVSFAGGINNAGQIVGNGGVTGPTVWNGTTPTTLGSLGGFVGVAYAINNAGQVVGYIPFNSNGFVQAVIWNGTIPTALGTLGGIGPPYDVFGDSSAHGINDAGEVVGTSFSFGEAGFNGSHAVIWNGTTPIDLNTMLNISGLDWTLLGAIAINNIGQIIGDGFDPLGQLVGFLLTPSSDPVVPTLPPPPPLRPPAATPLPAALPLFATGLGAMGLLGWRRKRKNAAAVAAA